MRAVTTHFAEDGKVFPSLRECAEWERRLSGRELVFVVEYQLDRWYCRDMSHVAAATARLLKNGFAASETTSECEGEIDLHVRRMYLHPDSFEYFD